MPVIPVSQGSQVLNASSPVPIASPSESRLAGNAIAEVGTGLYNTGLALNQVAKQTQAERQRLYAEDADASFQETLLKRQAEAMAKDPNVEDPTGYQAVEQFQQAARSDLDKIVASIPDEGARAAFYRSANKELLRTSQSIFADEIKKRAKVNDLLQDQIVSKKGALARSNPVMIPDLMDQAEASVLQNQSLSPVQRAEGAKAARKGVLQDGIQGLLMKNSYDNALKVLEDFSPGVLTVEEKNKQYDEIVAAKGKYFSQAVTQEDLWDKREQRNKKETEKKMYAQFHTEMLQAGNSNIERGLVTDKIEKAVAGGFMTPEKANALISAKSFAKAADDRYTKNFMTDLVRSGDFTTASQKLGQDMGLKVSNDQGAKLIQQLVVLEKESAKNPAFRSQIQKGEEVLKSYLSPEIVGTMSPAQKQRARELVDQTTERYYSIIADNPSMNPEMLAAQLYADAYKSQAPTQGARVESLSPEVITKMQQDLFKEAIDKKKKGLMSREMDKEYRDKIRALEEKKKYILIQTGAQQFNQGMKR